MWCGQYWCMILHSARLLTISKLQTNIQNFQTSFGKISGHENWKDVKCTPYLSLHFSIDTADNHNAKLKKKKEGHFTQYYPLQGRDDTIFTTLCFCSTGWAPAGCKHRSTSYLHSTDSAHRAPEGWCKDCCLVWSLSSGRKQARSSSCCQNHWVTPAHSFMLCIMSPCVRAVAVVSCQWPVPEVPSPFSTFSLQHLELFGFAILSARHLE